MKKMYIYRCTTESTFMKKFFTLVSFTVLIMLPLKLEAQATFTFTNTGTTPQIDSACAFAGNIWGQYLISSVPIKVEVFYGNLFGTTLAITIPNGRRDFPSAPLDSVWYPSCLANAMEGSEINPGEADMNIFFDSSQPWYFGTDANCPSNKYDFVTTLLHEIGHGLGFLSLSKLDGDTLGSFGYIIASDLAPLSTTFPFPDLQGKYSVFASYMETNTFQSLVDTALFPNPSNALGSKFKSNNIWFKGPYAMAQNGGNHVRIFAPTTFEKGSSMEHLNESTFPPSNINTLMTPYEGMSEEHHAPGPLTIQILRDIGWNMVPGIGIEDVLTNSRIHVFPNPVETTANIYLDESVDNGLLQIIDFSGRIVMTKSFTAQKGIYNPVDLSTLPTGIYLLRINGSSLKLIKS
jgi:hypothetical protein